MEDYTKLKDKVDELEKVIKQLTIQVEQLTPKPQKKEPVDLIKLYGLKPLSFYDN
jgi:hypothetical protein